MRTNKILIVTTGALASLVLTACGSAFNTVEIAPGDPVDQVEAGEDIQIEDPSTFELIDEDDRPVAFVIDGTAFEGKPISISVGQEIEVSGQEELTVTPEGIVAVSGNRVKAENPGTATINGNGWSRKVAVYPEEDPTNAPKKVETSTLEVTFDEEVLEGTRLSVANGTLVMSVDQIAVFPEELKPYTMVVQENLDGSPVSVKAIDEETYQVGLLAIGPGVNVVTITDKNGTEQILEVTVVGKAGEDHDHSDEDKDLPQD